MNNIAQYDQYVDFFLNYLKDFKQSSENTISSYSIDLKQWRSFLIENQKDWNNIVKQDIILFVFQLSSKNAIIKRTQSRKLSTLKHFYNFCLEEKYIDSNPLHNFLGPKYQKNLPKAISPIHMSILLEDKTNQTHCIQLRDRFLLEFLYSTGCRISEVLALNICDIFSGSCFLEEIIVQGKGERQRIVFLTERVKDIFLAYFQFRRERFQKCNILEEPLIINIQGNRLTRRGANYILQQRKKYLNIQTSSSMHSFRHSFATDILNEGGDIRKVQELLGHSSVSTTQNYTHIAKDRLFEIFRNSHPHAKE